MLNTIIKNFFSRILNIVIQFCSLVLINKLLGTQGRGEYSAIITWGLTFVTIFYLSINIGLLRYNYINKSKENTIQEIESMILYLPLIFGAIAIFISLAFPFVFPNVFKNVNAENYMMVMISLPFIIYNFYLQSYMQIKSNYKQLNILLYLPNLASLTFVFIAWQLNRLTVFSAAITYTAGQVIGVMPALVKLLSQKKVPFSGHAFAKVFKVSLIVHVATIITFIVNKFDVLLINYFKGNNDTGIYFLATSIVGFVIIVPSALQSVLYSKLSTKDSAFSPANICRVCRITMTGIFIGVAVLYFIVKPVVAIAGGIHYRDAETFLYILLPVCFFTTLGVTLSSYWNLIGIYRIINIFSFVIMIFSLAFNFFLIPRYGPVGASITYLASAFFSFLFHCYLAFKYLHIKNFGDILFPTKEDIHFIRNAIGKKQR
ncbi:MAG: polysaccharide biosynthesis C-terminal domain-containing protein [Ferruginibacter sp.]